MRSPSACPWYCWFTICTIRIPLPILNAVSSEPKKRHQIAQTLLVEPRPWSSPQYDPSGPYGAAGVKCPNVCTMVLPLAVCASRHSISSQGPRGYGVANYGARTADPDHSCETRVICHYGDRTQYVRTQDTRCACISYPLCMASSQHSTLEEYNLATAVREKGRAQYS